jgi:hypothetical protein
MANNIASKVLEHGLGKSLTILPMTNSVTYLETISGPYNKKETQFAKWAPSSDNSKESIKTFINNLTFNK